MKVHCPKCNSVNFLPSTLPSTSITNISCAVCKALINIPSSFRRPPAELNLPDDDLMDVSKLRNNINNKAGSLSPEQTKPLISDSVLGSQNPRLAPTQPLATQMMSESFQTAPTQQINTNQHILSAKPQFQVPPSANGIAAETKTSTAYNPMFLSSQQYESKERSVFWKALLTGLLCLFLISFIGWAGWQIVSSKKENLVSAQPTHTADKGRQTANPSISSQTASTGNNNSKTSSNSNSSTQNQNTSANTDSQEAKNQDPEKAKRERIVKTENTNTNEPAPSTNQDDSITIQVGSYPNSEDANSRVAKLQSMGFTARITKADIPKRGTWYRVQVGRFSSRREAEKYAQQLKSKGATKEFFITEVQ